MRKSKIIVLPLLAMLFAFVACDPDKGPGPIITEFSNKTITSDTIWSPDNGSITINGTLTVRGARLIILPGTILRFSTDAAMVIDGQNSELTAMGEADKPIIFTSSASNPQPGDWRGIRFTNKINTNTILKYCGIQYAGSNASYGSVYLNDASLTIENTTILDSKTHAVVKVSAGFQNFNNNLIDRCQGLAIKTQPDFAHTIGENNVINPQSVIEVAGGVFSLNAATWRRQTTPYVLDGELRIRGSNNPTLTIEKGASILMKSGGRISVSVSNNYGSLIAVGCADTLITFSSFSNTPQPGDWNYIQFNEGATGCILEYCNIEYGGGNNSWGMIDIDGNALVSIKNSIIGKSQNFPIQARKERGFVEFSGNTISSGTGHAMNIHGLHVHTIGPDNIFETPENSGIQVTGAASNSINLVSNAIWDAQNAPYIIEDQIRIRSNATLTIAPGAELRFIAGKYLEVGYLDNGRLIAVGTEEEKIIFTSASPAPQQGDWGSIRFTGYALEGSILDHCVISYGGSSSSWQGNITVDPCGQGNPVIRNSEISNSKYFGIFLKRISSDYGDPLLENNIFVDNNSGDIGQQ
jgi:hypothetical protein